MAACFEHVQESCGSMDVKVGDLLVGKRCNWLVESLLACGTCSQVFQVRAVEETGYSAAHGCWTAALKVFRKGNNYESAAQNEVHIREDLSDGGEALADCIVLQLMDHFHHNQHVCLVYEKLAYNLHHVLLRNSNKGSLPLGIIQKLSEHLLRSLQHFARKGIVHGDVKPGNIMWNASRGVFQLIDFGLSFYEGKQVELVQCVQSPGYVCPEAHRWNKMSRERQMSGMTQHICNCASDMWSLACVLVQVYSGKAPGSLMKPSHSPSTECAQCSQKCVQCEYTSHLERNLSLPEDGRCITKKQHEAFTDLVSRMMKCQPNDRIRPQEALAHPFLTEPKLISGLSLSEMLLLPTRSLQLVNMYGDPGELADPEERQDFLADVEQECAKHGNVVRVFIPEGNGSQPCEGKVCVEYESAESCEKAVSALMGRTFNNRTVITSYYPHYLQPDDC